MTARRALSKSDVNAAHVAAHRALCIARDARLMLIQIDALEASRSSLSRPGTATSPPASSVPPPPNGQGRGYLGRLTSPADQSLVDRLASTMPTALAMGAAESLDEATALATGTGSPT